jgi:3-phenylpropionate/trans-cinnamate dioxygenase ferredoxin subunit
VSEFLKVCAIEEIAVGGSCAVELDGLPVALVRTGKGEVHAIYDECSHAAVPLSEGEIEDCTVECWLHGSRFDLRSGAPTGLPATEPVPVYPVEIRDGFIFVSTTPSNGVNP